MSKRLIERTVQEKAQKYLENYYQIKHNPKKIFSQLEARTKKQYGGKRADGLLAFAKSKKKAYVVSMEAKSHKTLPALKPYRVNKLWIRESIWWGVLSCLASGSMFMWWNGTSIGITGLENFFIPLIPFFIGFTAHLLLMKNSYKFQEMKVVHQVFQYPGNEQWLSLSQDALERIDPKLQKNLTKICEARGIGVLIVNEQLQVALVAKPEKRNKFLKDFLIYYSKEIDIRKYLSLKK